MARVIAPTVRLVGPQGSASLRLSAGERVGRITSRLVTLLLVFSCIVAIAVFALAIAQSALGYKAYAVLSGSMTPTMPVGAMGLSHPVPMSDVGVGDVITFHPPHQPALVVTHRVKAVVSGGGIGSPVAAPRYFVTKGDGNQVEDPWRVPAIGTVDRVVWHAPGLGYLLVALQDKVLRVVLMMAPLALLGLLVMVEIWRPHPEAGLEAVPA